VDQAGDAGRLGEWQRRAAETRARFHAGSPHEGVASSNPWAELDPELASVVNDLAMGVGYAAPELDLKTRALCTVAALVACGEERYAANWMHNALAVGATPEELVSLVRQLFVYLGTPRTVAGFSALRSVLEDRDG
jgi:4-carboxymuconolactone decarboxylase